MWLHNKGPESLETSLWHSARGITWHKWLLGYGSELLSNNSLIFKLLSALRQSRMEKRSAPSFESIDLYWFTGGLYLKQQTRGEGFGPNPTHQHTRPAQWATQLYKVSFTLSAGRYTIHMDGHTSSLGHTCSARRRNCKWPFGTKVHFTFCDGYRLSIIFYSNIFIQYTACVGIKWIKFRYYIYDTSHWLWLVMGWC